MDLRGVVMVATAGTVRTEQAGGMADAAALLLVESGRLALDDPLDRWLPGAPPQWSGVTLHHLLSHTAGVPHWHEAPGMDPDEPMSLDERLAAIQWAPLRAAPGEQWHYSSPGFILAGHIVARASGRPYPRFLTEQILSPLQLTATTMGGVPSGAACGHRGGQPVPPWNMDVMPGSGDIWSTAGDLTRFTAALHAGDVITADSLRAMCTPLAALQDDDPGEPRLTTTGYGYGMFTGTFGRYTAYFHPGDNPGYRSLAAWIPDQATSIVILLNDESVPPEGVLRQMLPVALTPAGPGAG